VFTETDAVSAGCYFSGDETAIVDDGSGLHPQSLTLVRRHPLQDDVEDLVHKIETSADIFLSFLQQNYVHFFGDMDDIVTASSILADSEHILSRWPFDDSGIRSFKVSTFGLLICSMYPKC
jgi:hypothetical protein